MRVGLVGLWWIKSTRLTLMADNAHRAHQRAIALQVSGHPGAVSQE